MLAIISPAKSLDYESALPSQQHSQADLLAHSAELIDILQTLSPADVASLMKVSDKIAGLNVARFAQWQAEFDLNSARAAIFAFKGDVYTGLDAYSLSPQELEYAQQHLRILSGLYGVLRPLDLIMPYRLEMGTKLSNARGNNLYQFWGSQLSESINQAVLEQGDNVVVNLASNEYFKALPAKFLNAKVITPIFKDFKNGQYKIISFYAKKARGLMLRYILQQQLSEPEQLTGFAEQGYRFDEASSNAQNLVFLRDEPSA